MERYVGLGTTLHLALQVEGPFGPHETRFVHFDATFTVPRTPSVVIVAEEQVGSHLPPSSPLRMKFRAIHSQEELDLLNLEVRNASDQPLPAKSFYDLNVVVFALPLPRVHAAPLHIFFNSALKPSRETFPTCSKTVVRRACGAIWGVRTALSNIAWTEGVGNRAHVDRALTVTVLLSVKPACMTHVDSLTEINCSHEDVQVFKAEVFQKGRPNVLGLTLQTTAKPPPKKLTLFFQLLASHAQVVMRHNPYPALQSHPSNGFTIHCPGDIRLQSGQTYRLTLRNGFDSTSHAALFFPADFPNADVSGGQWKARHNMDIVIRSHGETTVRKDEVLGTVHFFDNDLFTFHRVAGVIDTCMMGKQFETRVRRCSESCQEQVFVKSGGRRTGNAARHRRDRDGGDDDDDDENEDGEEGEEDGEEDVGDAKDDGSESSSESELGSGEDNDGDDDVFECERPLAREDGASGSAERETLDESEDPSLRPRRVSEEIFPSVLFYPWALSIPTGFCAYIHYNVVACSSEHSSGEVQDGSVWFDGVPTRPASHACSRTRRDDDGGAGTSRRSHRGAQ
uniref:GP83 n=1 Tax=Caviid herpesvirus 2 str. CIDMTR TaxID=1415526 RepID=U6H6S1_9BETA|nr:GP83 [Caviid herpesvirus 2 str. CIDMTR]